MFYKSIRFKITVIYMVIMALVLSLFGASLYHYVHKSLNDNMDSLLRTKSEGIIHAINTYWEGERFGVRRSVLEPRGEIPQGEDYVKFNTVALQWVEERSKDPKLLDIIVQIYSTGRQVVASSKNTRGIKSVSSENFRAALNGQSSFETLTPSFPTKKATRFRVFISPAIQDSRVKYVVQVASPLTSMETALGILRVTLFVLLPVAVILTGLVGAFMATLTLRPVDKMIKTIHGITAETMGTTIALPGTKDEIQKLAETFNDMLVRLSAAFTAQKELLENLSHELKTPLTILKGEYEVILKRSRQADEYEFLLKNNLEEIEKLVRLVDNLLVMASLESRKIVPHFLDLELGLLVRGAINSLKRFAEKKRVIIDFRDSGGVVLRGDQEQLKRLFANLIENAVKYTPEGGNVYVRTSHRGAEAVISIKDTGPGIPDGEAKRIFDRFYRADKSRSGKGFGLGLSIAKAIVEAHKGSIEAASVPGEGAVFTVRLPL